MLIVNDDIALNFKTIKHTRWFIVLITFHQRQVYRFLAVHVFVTVNSIVLKAQPNLNLKSLEREYSQLSNAVSLK